MPHEWTKGLGQKHLDANIPAYLNYPEARFAITLLCEKILNSGASAAARLSESGLLKQATDDDAGEVNLAADILVTALKTVAGVTEEGTREFIKEKGWSNDGDQGAEAGSGDAQEGVSGSGSEQAVGA